MGTEVKIPFQARQRRNVAWTSWCQGQCQVLADGNPSAQDFPQADGTIALARREFDNDSEPALAADA